MSQVQLIVGLAVGLGAGMLVITGLGLLTGYLIKRHWITQRKKSFKRANAQLWQPTELEKGCSFVEPENTDHLLYNIPCPQEVITQPATPCIVKEVEPHSDVAQVPGPAATAMSPLFSLPSSPVDDLRFPAAVAEHAAQISQQPLERHTTMRADSSDANHSFTRNLSLRFAFPTTRSRVTRSQSHRHSRLSQSMLSHIPSRLRSTRSSRQISSDSGHSIGAPDSQLPMARRIERNQPRFQYDSSSYSSSILTGENDEAVMTPQDVISPPPPALLAPEEHKQLYERIFAWQESSQQAIGVGDKDYATPLSGIQEHRSPSISSERSSLYSRPTASEMHNPYMGAGSQLMRIPSIRPQFAAETSLESWLGTEDPRTTLDRQPSRSDLFGEVPMGGDENLLAEEPTISVQRATPDGPDAPQQAPKLATAASVDDARLEPISLRYAPRTPSPLGLHSTTLTALERYESATTSSSRSSFPSSARMSGDMSNYWKHHSGTTVGTELTWVDEEEVPAAKEEAPVPRPLSSGGRDDGAQPTNGNRNVSLPDIEHVGYAFDPTELDKPHNAVQWPASSNHDAHRADDAYTTPVNMRPPSSQALIAPRSSLAESTMASGTSLTRQSSSASSASVRTFETEVHAHADTLLSSPMETIVAWYRETSDKPTDHASLRALAV